jgi:hypothetical protein
MLKMQQIVIENVPISIGLGDETMEDIERDNGWKKGSITSLKGIKAAERKSTRQRYDHMIITLNNTKCENEGQKM